MPVFNRQTCTKALSIGIILMGFVHIAATFTPLIAGKLALLPVGVSDAFTYFSLMCGALLVLGGGVTFSLAERIKEHPFLRKPCILAIVILVIDGVLAVCSMPNNPFAWLIFALTMGLLLANITRFMKG